MFNKFLSIVAAFAVLTTGIISASNVGDVVESQRQNGQRITLPANGALAPIAGVVLDEGVWMVSGHVNLVTFQAPPGLFVITSQISQFPFSPQPSATQSVDWEIQVGTHNNIFNISLPSRMIDVPHDIAGGQATYFVVCGVREAPGATQTTDGWGFISAVKVANH
jgi:hypothetical protein